MSDGSDVLVVGGGIIGLAIAREAARSGFVTRLLERAEPGCGSSGAAAGMLMPHIESDDVPSLQSLAISSRRLFPKFVERIREESGIDPQLMEDGSLLLAHDPDSARDLVRRASRIGAAGLRVERVGPDDLRRLEPALEGDLPGGLLLPDDASLDNVLLMRGLHLAAIRSGVRVETGACVRRIQVEGRRVVGVITDSGRHSASTVIIAAGAWSSEIAREIEGGGLPLPHIHPVRGQIVCLRPAKAPFHRILMGESLYLVRRRDGRVLVGSTMERVGFDSCTTAEAVAALTRKALSLIPALGEAPLDSAWAGLRPATEDGLPAIGHVGIEGLLVASGHLRHGILLAPVTARLVVQLLRGEPPEQDLSAFDPLRLLRKDGTSTGGRGKSVGSPLRPAR